jgi:hypothetical protein
VEVDVTTFGHVTEKLREQGLSYAEGVDVTKCMKMQGAYFAVTDSEKQLVSEEANRLEGMEEWKARILGISKEHVI